MFDICYYLHVQAFAKLPEYVQKELQELVLRPMDNNKPNDPMDVFELDFVHNEEEEEFDGEEPEVEEEGLQDEVEELKAPVLMSSCVC